MSKRLAEKVVKEFLETHPERREAPCHLFGVCGGCDIQDLPQELQLELKREIILKALSAHPELAEVQILPVRRYREPWRYRNKVEMTFAQEGAETFAGFAKKGRWDRAVPVTDCLLVPARATKMAQAVEAMARREGMSTYNPRTHEGFLRNLVIRVSHTTPDLLVNIVATEEDFPDEEFARICGEHGASGVMRTVYRGVAQVVKMEDSRLLLGSQRVRENIGGLMFGFSPESFFQTSPRLASKTMERAVTCAAPSDAERVLDLYCGVGTLSLLMALRVREVVGVEVMRASIDDAALNAEANGIQNVEFICCKAEDYRLARGAFDIALVDPPRAGCHRKVIENLLEALPSRIVYMSCNPFTMGQDLALLAKAYDVGMVEPYDLFPQTLHMEAVALLRLRGTR
jgi:23S rRNA (uracil-5-)-methyltransferase RumA